MRTVVPVLALATLLAPPSHATLLWAHVPPTSVQIGAPVEVTIRGLLPNPCWDFMGGACHDPDQGIAQVNVVIWNCNVHPPGSCGICLAVVVPYEYTCSFVFDTPGRYVIRAIEYADSAWVGRSYELTHELEVIGAMSEDAVSWSRVKAIYR